MTTMGFGFKRAAEQHMRPARLLQALLPHPMSCPWNGRKCLRGSLFAVLWGGPSATAETPSPAKQLLVWAPKKL